MRLLSGDAQRAVFAPLDDGVVRSEVVVRRLGSAIALGLIADGEQLPAEAALATSLNVSTMTLRDALADLRRRGLVVTRRGRQGGSFARARPEALAGLSRVRLAELGSSDLRELGDLQSAIAGMASKLAALRASDVEIARLREIVDRLFVTPGAIDRRRLDVRFHVELAACSQSVRLTQAQIDLQSEAGQIPWPAGDSDEYLGTLVAGYGRVIDAIEARDADLARTRMEQVVLLQTRWVVRLRIDLATGAGAGDQDAGTDRTTAAAQ